MFSLSAPNKLVIIDHARHAAFVVRGLFSADHASLAANAHVMIAADNVRRQGDFELDVRPNLQLRVGMDINAGRAYVLGCS
jgi:hypothetical protein